MSTTFSLVVYVKPPHARSNTPSAMRITPIVFLTPSSAADSDRAPRPSSSFLKRSNVGPATAIGGLSHSFPGQLYADRKHRAIDYEEVMNTIKAVSEHRGHKPE